MIIAVAFVVAFLIFSVIAGKYKIYDIEYNPHNKNHKALLILSTGLFVVLCVVIFSLLSTNSLVYPFRSKLIYYNGYEQLFDAFMKKQLNLDIEVDELFSLLNNPYDWSERDLLNVIYPWDRVLYNNQYFSYFGIAPLLLIYFPFYFITGKVPTSPTVCFILSIIAIIAIALLTVKLFRIFCKNVNLWLLNLSLLAVESGSLILMVQSSADMYYTAVCSGVTFLALFLLFTFTAYSKKRTRDKCIYFSLSAIALSFLVMSRPNLAIFFLLAVPVYISVLVSKRYMLKHKICQVISFAFPVIIGAAVVMWYNYARFGSVFEFGAKYQLTVYDVSKYEFTSRLIFPSIYYYFLQIAGFKEKFPYLVIPYVPLESYHEYVYVTSTIGMLSFPSVWGWSFLPCSLTKRNNNVKKSVFSLAIILCFALAFFNTCMAGVNIRYLVDIALISVLFSSLILCDLFNLFKTSKNTTRYILFLIISLLLSLTFLLGLMMIFNNERDNLLKLFN